MGLIAIPNVSEGRDLLTLEHLTASVTAHGAQMLDVHADPRHNRAVFTTSGSKADLVAAVAALALEAKRSIDLTQQRGVHPRVGVLDVCPFVPHDVPMADAVAVAKEAASAIGETAELPVYLYGAAAAREGTRELPAIRRGGLERLMERAAAGLSPDFGPKAIDPRFGVVCVGARDVLIAFNVWLRAGEDVARKIAASIRTSGGGPPGVRALGVAMGEGVSQVTMNLVDPGITGIDRAFGLVSEAAERYGADVTATEIVGLVPKRFLPDPSAEAARLLKEPGRSLESVLEGLLAPPS
jgi:glutamate formiminotransferase